MINCTELRHELSQLFAEVKSGAIEVKTAEAMTNIAGKMIRSAQSQIEYYERRGDKTTQIPFLEESAK